MNTSHRSTEKDVKVMDYWYNAVHENIHQPTERYDEPKNSFTSISPMDGYSFILNTFTSITIP